MSCSSSGRPVAPGDTLALTQRMAPTPVWPLKPGAPAGRVLLEVAYEDDHMAVVVKPQGMPTQVQGRSPCALCHVACVRFLTRGVP